MKKGSCISVLIVLLLSPVTSGYTQTFHADFVDSQLFVKVHDTSDMDLAPYDSSHTKLNTLLNSFKVRTITRPFGGHNDVLDRTYRFYFRDIQRTDSLIQELETLNFIEYAEKAPLYHTQVIPNDYDAEVQWYLDKIEMPGGWEESTGDTALTIAIVDNAVNHEHEDLIGNRWFNENETENGLDSDLNGYVDDIYGYDVADNNNDPLPPSNAVDTTSWTHGTSVAGIASAVTNNNMGMASPGYRIKVISVKCAPDNSDGKTLTNAYDGVDYAISAGADIINMSWGSSQFSATGQNIINTAHNNDIVLIGAAGNDDSDESFYPAAFNPVIGVGATDKQDKKANFSNYGDYVDVMAPGVQLYTLLGADNNSTYGHTNGTSVATPLVSGLAGLVIDKYGSIPPEDVKDTLKKGCTNIDSLNPDYAGDLGAGRINARATLDPAYTETVNVPPEPVVISALQVYPNPAATQVTLAWQTPNPSPATVKLISMAGQVLLTAQHTADQKMQLSVHDLPTGLYVLQIITTSDTLTRSLIVR